MEFMYEYHKDYRVLNILVFPVKSNDAAIRITQEARLTGRYEPCRVDCFGYGGLSVNECEKLLAGWVFAMEKVKRWDKERVGKHWSEFPILEGGYG